MHFIGIESVFIINDTVIENIQVTSQGGGFQTQQGELYVYNCTVSDVTALEGGFAHLQGLDVIQIHNSDFSNMQSTDPGS